MASSGIGPSTPSEGIQYVHRLVQEIALDFAQRAPLFVFQGVDPKAAPSLPSRADVSDCNGLFRQPTDVWEDLAMDFIREYYFTAFRFFKRYFDEDDLSINEFYRFLAISFLCGPDRALRSIEKEDDLFESGLPQGDSDVMYQSIFNLLIHRLMPFLQTSEMSSMGLSEQEQEILTQDHLAKEQGRIPGNNFKMRSNQELKIFWQQELLILALSRFLKDAAHLRHHQLQQQLQLLQLCRLQQLSHSLGLLLLLPFLRSLPAQVLKPRQR
jgi:hypothetical protein